MSVRTPRCVAASALKRSAMRRTVSKSVRVCHGGLIAGLNAWINGCMSVDDRSCFSYQVAAGSTTSVNSVVLVMRKSSSTAGRACPRAPPRASACPRAPSGGLGARTAESAPSRCLRKYSLPFPDEPSMFAAPDGQHARKVLGRVGVLDGVPSDPSVEAVDDVCGRLLAGRLASSERSSGLRSNVG